MTTDTRTADEIERDIENERAQMTGTINDLQKKFSVEGMMDDVRTMFSDQGGDIGRMITQTVARNPAAVVLTGVGLAWLLMGPNRQIAASSYDDQRMQPRPGMKAQRDLAEHRFAQQRDQTKWNRNDEYFNDTTGIDRSWIDDHWRDTAQRGVSNNNDNIGNGGTVSERSAHRSKSVVGRVTEAASDAFATVKGAASDVVDSATGAASGAMDTVRDMSERFLHGTDGFSDEAKARVRAAREAAYNAKTSTQDVLKSGSQKAADFFDDQPLIMGALAIALGAAIGRALPGTKVEDDAMGDTSHHLFAEAQRIFGEERAKAMAVVDAVTEEAKNTFEDARSELSAMVPEGKTAAGTIADRIGGAATRVLDTAKDEAARQELGQINT